MNVVFFHKIRNKIDSLLYIYVYIASSCYSLQSDERIIGLCQGMCYYNFFHLFEKDLEKLSYYKYHNKHIISNKVMASPTECLG